MYRTLRIDAAWMLYQLVGISDSGRKSVYGRSTKSEQRSCSGSENVRLRQFKAAVKIGQVAAV